MLTTLPTSDVRTMKFLRAYGAEDHYYCAETSRFYVRQPCDKEHVRWLTVSKQKGAHEPNSPVRAGLEIRIADNSGNVLFTEHIVREEGYDGTVAKKVAPFSYDAIKVIANAFRETNSLASYEDWKAWLMAEAEAANFTGYYDNWLYDASCEDLHKIEAVTVLGKELYLTSQQRRHRVCGKVWTCYELYSEELITCEAICGYVLNENK